MSPSIMMKVPTPSMPKSMNASKMVSARDALLA